MRDAAARALEVRATKPESQRGMTPVGIARARALKAGKTLSPDTVRRMLAFLTRHEVDKQATGFREGEEGCPSAGRIAWDLWGGDAGFRWSTRKRDQIMKEREKAVVATPTNKTNGSAALAPSGIS